MSFSEVIARRGLNSPFDVQIATSANAYGVDPALVKAIISQECPTWNPQCINPNDPSYGLMQILLGSRGPYPNYTASQLLDPSTNIDLGTRYLATQLTRFGYPDGISAYNAGRPISTNQLSYVAPVIAYQSWFQTNDPLFGAPTENPTRPLSPAAQGEIGGSHSSQGLATSLSMHPPRTSPRC